MVIPLVDAGRLWSFTLHAGIFFMGTGFTEGDLATLQYSLTNYTAARVHHASLRKFETDVIFLEARAFILRRDGHVMRTLRLIHLWLA